MLFFPKGRLFSIIFATLVHFFLINFNALYSQVPSREVFNFYFENDFNDDQLGDYVPSDFISDWNKPYGTQLHADVDIISENNSKYAKFMRGYFPQGKYLEKTSGWLWGCDLVNPQTELYFSYDIRFKQGFEWVKGGKIPGISGGTIVSGAIPTSSDGFSARMMWKEDGRLVFYVYHQDQEIIYGSSYTWGTFKFNSGQWYNITIRLVLNSVKNGSGLNNGILEGFVDGKLMFQKSDFKFRSIESIKIDNLFICAFFGGGDESWAALRNEWIDTDNYVAYSYRSDVLNVPRGFQLSNPNKILIRPYYSFSDLEWKKSFVSSTSNATTVNFSWSDYPVPVTYTIERKEEGISTNFTKIATLPYGSKSFIDSNLKPSSKFTYRIIAGNSISDPLTVLTFIPRIPSTPSNLVASHIEYTSATFQWLDKSDNENGFEILRNGPNDNTISKVFKLPANATSYIDTGLIMNSTYQYRVRAYNIDGASAWSNMITIVTPRILPPMPPSNLKSTNFTEKSISICWNDNADNEDAFILTRALAVDPSTSTSIKLPANKTDFQDTSLSSGTTYQYSIKAVNRGGSSSLSNKNVATTLSVAESKRFKEGLIAYYNFGFNHDYIIYDQSGYDEPLNLQVLNRSAVSWNKDNTIDILGNTALVSVEPAHKITKAIKSTNEITFECWVKPKEPSFSDSRIVSLSSDDNHVGFLVNQLYNEDPLNKSISYGVRMQTLSTNESGYPEYLPGTPQKYLNLEHLVYVRDCIGTETFYLNGEKSKESYRPSDLTGWDDNFFLRLGNESDMNHLWKGSYYSVAIFNKALSADQVKINYKAGPCDSLNYEKFNFQVLTYPNPITDKAVIQIIPENLPDFVELTYFRIIDMLGNILYEEHIFNPNYLFTKELDFSCYPSGIYFLQVVSGKTQKSIKLVIKH